MKQIDGQMSLFDFIPETKPETKLLPCDTCGHDIKGCCDYDYIKNHDYCALGSKWIPKEKPICDHSGHTCNKQNLWEIADTLDDLQCPHVCCRICSTKNCGARCNGSEEPKEQTDDYIKENPTCFYVFGHYLDRAAGWHKVPDELPIFNTWRLIDVVVFGKKTGTAWMEHGKWEAKDWAFRSIDDRGNAETTEVLAWKLSELESTQDLENVTLEELNKKITERIGIKFEENPEYPGEYVAKIKGGYTLEFSFSTYMTEDGGDGKKMILLGWSNKKGEGGGSPGDSIEEAVDYFKKALRRIEEDKHKKEQNARRGVKDGDINRENN